MASVRSQPIPALPVSPRWRWRHRPRRPMPDVAGGEGAVGDAVGAGGESGLAPAGEGGGAGGAGVAEGASTSTGNHLKRNRRSSSGGFSLGLGPALRQPPNLIDHSSGARLTLRPAGSAQARVGRGAPPSCTSRECRPRPAGRSRRTRRAHDPPDRWCPLERGSRRRRRAASTPHPRGRRAWG